VKLDQYGSTKKILIFHKDKLVVDTKLYQMIHENKSPLFGEVNMVSRVNITVPEELSWSLVDRPLDEFSVYIEDTGKFSPITGLWTTKHHTTAVIPTIQLSVEGVFIYGLNGLDRALMKVKYKHVDQTSD